MKHWGSSSVSAESSISYSECMWTAVLGYPSSLIPQLVLTASTSRGFFAWKMLCWQSSLLLLWERELPWLLIQSAPHQPALHHTSLPCPHSCPTAQPQVPAEAPSFLLTLAPEPAHPRPHNHQWVWKGNMQPSHSSAATWSPRVKTKFKKRPKSRTSGFLEVRRGAPWYAADRQELRRQEPLAGGWERRSHDKRGKISQGWWALSLTLTQGQTLHLTSDQVLLWITWIQVNQYSLFSASHTSTQAERRDGDLAHPARRLAWSLGTNSASVPGSLILKAPKYIDGELTHTEELFWFHWCQLTSSKELMVGFCKLISLLPSWQMEKAKYPRQPLLLPGPLY